MVGRRNELNYRITGDSRGFNQAVGQADAAIARFDRSVAGSVQRVEAQFSRMNAAVAGVTAGLAAIGATSAVRGLADFARSSFESAEQIDRLSQSLGVSAETVQELSFAFKQFGLERDDVADALGTIAERAQDALDGSSDAAEGFRRVGIALDDLRGRAPDELFRQFAEAVSEIDDPTRRTAAIIGTLGDDLGRQLAPALVDGAEGFDELARKAREAGQVLDDDAVRASAALNESLRELSDRTLGQVSNAFQTATVNAARFFGLLEGSGVVAEFGGVQGAVEALQRQQDIVARLGERLASGTVQGRNRRGVESALDAATQEAQRISAAITKFQNAIDEAAERAAPTFDPPGGGGGGTRSRPPIADVDLEPLRRMEALIAANVEGTGTLESQFGDIDRAVGQLGFTFSSAFEDAILQGENLRGVLNGILQDIARITLRQTVTQPLAGAVSGGLNSLFTPGNLFGPSLGSAYNLPSQNIGGTEVLRLPGFADGGSFTVNDNFPSVNAGRDNRLVSFFARDGERVDVSPRGGGGEVINVDASTTINAQGAGPREVDEIKRAVARDRATFESRVVKAVREAKSARKLA
jgi:hypothetical protein